MCKTGLRPGEIREQSGQKNRVGIVEKQTGSIMRRRQEFRLSQGFNPSSGGKERKGKKEGETKNQEADVVQLRLVMSSLKMRACFYYLLLHVQWRRHARKLTMLSAL